MRWEDLRRSTNVEDRRGFSGGVGLAGGGIGAVAVVIIALLFGIDPSILLQGDYGPTQTQETRSGEPDEMRDHLFSDLARVTSGPGCIEANGSVVSPRRNRCRRCARVTSAGCPHRRAAGGRRRAALSWVGCRAPCRGCCCRIGIDLPLSRVRPHDQAGVVCSERELLPALQSEVTSAPFIE